MWEVWDAFFKWAFCRGRFGLSIHISNFWDWHVLEHVMWISNICYESTFIIDKIFCKVTMKPEWESAVTQLLKRPCLNTSRILGFRIQARNLNTNKDNEMQSKKQKYTFILCIISFRGIQFYKAEISIALLSSLIFPIMDPWFRGTVLCWDTVKCMCRSMALVSFFPLEWLPYVLFDFDPNPTLTPCPCLAETALYPRKHTIHSTLSRIHSHKANGWILRHELW